MNIERRSVLKGMALGSLASIAASSSGLSMAQGVFGAQSRPLLPSLVLVSSETAQSVFLQGINACTANTPLSVQRTDLGLGFIQAFDQRLRSGQAQRIIGLVDDASAALIVDLARSAGARVHWLGQHRATASASEHQLLSAESASGCAAQLGLSLNTCGSAFSLSEQRLHGLEAPLQISAAARERHGSDQWAATLGYTLAGLGSHHLGQPPVISRQASPLRGHFVSFLIEA